MDRGTPDLVRHCVAAVAAKDGDTERAFAICVSQLQKNGYLEPGTMKLTAAGRAKEKEHEAEPDAKKKLASYEKILKAARKDESKVDWDPFFYEKLVRPEAKSGLEDAPDGLRRRHSTVDESSMDKMRRLAGISHTGTKLRETALDPVSPKVFQWSREVVAFTTSLSQRADEASEKFAGFAEDKTLDRKVKAACDNASRILEMMSESATELEAVMAFLQKATKG
jgi:hypothetical protein